MPLTFIHKLWHKMPRGAAETAAEDAKSIWQCMQYCILLTSHLNWGFGEDVKITPQNSEYSVKILKLEIFQRSAEAF